MNTWQALLEKISDVEVLPWLGGRTLQHGPRIWRLDGPLPAEYGWYAFNIRSRAATVQRPADDNAVADAKLKAKTFVQGFLVGDHLVLEAQTGRAWCPACHRFLQDPHFPHRACGTCMTPTIALEKVHLLEPLERFSRIQAARYWVDGPLVFQGQVMPLGPEPDVQAALDDARPNLDHIPGVTPALRAAFDFEVWTRAEVIRRREAAAKARAEAEAKAQREARQAELVRQLGSAEGRREMALHDFAQAATAALAVGGAQYLDHRPSAGGRNAHEMVVRFRFLNRRFECTCDRNLRIIDAGICLIDHHTEERGDTRFTLESLPAVIREADTDGKLVVFRHA